jgi:N-acetylglucosaminyldiphosphoundecaprenol N-acetyl-beta-D-mannosaminyltransferase
MPVVWYLKSKGAKDVTRVYGPDLMRETFYVSEVKGYRHYFYGGTEDILSKLKENLLIKFPSLNICGMYAPPFRPLTEKEEDEVISDIKKAEPHIVWVVIGSPKQEKWMAKVSPCLDGILMAGVGAAFNFYAGSVRQAHLWMQRNGIEWLF